MNEMKTHIITTGGTIDKSYNESDGTLLNRSSEIKKFITDKLRLPYNQLEFHSILNKDSLDMTSVDREQLTKLIQSLCTNKTPVVVIHGTDTMDQSAKACYDAISSAAAPVVFTGAMRPLGFEDSDARQNVTEALFAARVAAPGVYISFHGALHLLPNVRKNHQKGTFESFQTP